MQKTKRSKLQLSRETLRELSAERLHRVGGGLSYLACRTDTVQWCPEPSLIRTNCQACGTDVCV